MDAEMFRIVRLWVSKTQPEFAKMLGISPGTVGKIETGRLDVSPRIKAKVVSRIDLNQSFFDFYHKMRKLS